MSADVFIYNSFNPYYWPEYWIFNAKFILISATVEPEEKALTDGRIGPELVGVDRNSLYGSMNVKEGIEVSVHSYFVQEYSHVHKIIILLPA